tara:strand:+ start:131 stop:370 length:240 start_codon:yes stop_codon:yes gene_type:complete
VLLRNIHWYNKNTHPLPIRAARLVFLSVLLAPIFILLLIISVFATFVFGFLIFLVKLAQYFQPRAKKDDEGRKNVRIKH